MYYIGCPGHPVLTSPSDRYNYRDQPQNSVPFTQPIMISLTILMLLVGTSLAVLETRDGVFVDVLDNCVPEDPYSCGEGYCCVKNDYIYVDGHAGDRPAYRLQCEPLRQEGSWCLGHPGGAVCPCAAGLECLRGRSFLRRCTRTY